MNIKTLLLGLVAMVVSSVSVAGIPNLDGPGALPPDAEPGQCFVHKFVPPHYSHTTVDVVIKEAYTKYTVTPPVFEIVEEPVATADGYSTWTVNDPVFDYEMQKIMIVPNDPVWKVKCCKDDHKACDNQCDNHHAKNVGDDLAHNKIHHKHEKNKPCEQACFNYVRPKYKVYKKRVTVTDGSADPSVTSQEFTTIKYKKLVKDAILNSEYFPEVTMSVKVYTLDHPGYMKWVEGTCKQYTCDPRDLQGALKEKGYYNGSIDGIVGPATISAMNNFRKDNGLAESDIIDEVTAKALGIKS